MKAQLFDKSVRIDAPSGSTALMILIAKAYALILRQANLTQPNVSGYLSPLFDSPKILTGRKERLNHVEIFY